MNPNMKYIAVIDYDRLDHPLFMKSFSGAMGQQKSCTGIILHGDSAYTERLIQTGMMREDAVLRSTSDLNHRIVALLADNSVSAVGVNGYQKNIISLSGDKLSIDSHWIDSRPPGTHLILSNLVRDQSSQKITPVSLRTLTDALSHRLECRTVFLFSREDENDSLFTDRANQKSIGTKNRQEVLRLVPEELLPPPKNSYLGTTHDFANLPDISHFHPLFPKNK